MPFWRQLEKGNQHFKATGHDVAVGVCGGHYVFDVKSANGQPLEAEAACPPLKANPEIEAKAEKIDKADAAAVAQLVARGVRPVRLVYQDGAQNPVFSHRFADVSRPDALTAPIELALDDPRSRLSARARHASPAAAIVLAQEQARRQAQAEKLAEFKAERQAPSEKQAPQAANEPLAAARSQGEMLASMIGSFGHHQAAPAIAPAAPQVTEIAKTQTESAKSAKTRTESATAAVHKPKLVNRFARSGPAVKPPVKAGADKPQAMLDKAMLDEARAHRAASEKVASVPAPATEQGATLR